MNPQNPVISNYSFNEHTHRYALWTAARAVQRSFTTTDRIVAAIESTTLRQFAENTKTLTPEEYNLQQAEWCYKIMECFEPLECSYGRAAKMVAIYLKTAVILPQNASSELCDIIHPPIDGILLKNLTTKRKLKELAGKTWTTFTDTEYWNVVDIIRIAIGSFDWKLEVYWELPQQKLQTTEIE